MLRWTSATLPPKQSKPTLSKHPRSGDFSFGGGGAMTSSKKQSYYRFLIIGVMVLATVCIYGNLQLIATTPKVTTTSSSHGSAMDPSHDLSSIVKRNSKPRPFFFVTKEPSSIGIKIPNRLRNGGPPENFADEKLLHLLRAQVNQWDRWADPNPYSGSYINETTKSMMHFPILDLDTYYARIDKQQPSQQQQQQVDPNHKDYVDENGQYVYSIPQVHASSSSSSTSSYAVVTRKGDKFLASGVKANQDRIVIQSPFLPRNGDENNNWYMGLFDGHGEFGHVISHFAVLHFPTLLAERLETLRKPTTTDTISSIFNQTSYHIHNNLPHPVATSGSTGINILKLDKKLYLSTIGDSEAFIAKFPNPTIGNDNDNNVAEIIFTTKPHKPDDPLEQARIEQMGGRILPPPEPGVTARVLIPTGEINPLTGQEMDMALAMSRSIGDTQGSAYGVIPEPTTVVIDLETDERFTSNKQDFRFIVVTMSDGLCDKVLMPEIASHIAKTLRAGTGSSISLAGALEQLVLRSSEEWKKESFAMEEWVYRDDISVAVHALEW